MKIDPKIIDANNNSCIEHGYHKHVEGVAQSTVVVRSFEDIRSPELCQSLCNANKRCKWFNWGDDRLPNGCWLIAQKATKNMSDFGRDRGATGPKNCIGWHLLKNKFIYIYHLKSFIKNLYRNFKYDNYYNILIFKNSFTDSYPTDDITRSSLSIVVALIVSFLGNCLFLIQYQLLTVIIKYICYAILNAPSYISFSMFTYMLSDNYGSYVEAQEYESLSLFTSHLLKHIS